MKIKNATQISSYAKTQKDLLFLFGFLLCCITRYYNHVQEKQKSSEILTGPRDSNQYNKYKKTCSSHSSIFIYGLLEQ